MAVMGAALGVLFRHAPWMSMSLPFTFVLMLLSFEGAWFSTAGLSSRRATIVMSIALACIVAVSLTSRKWRGRMRDLMLGVVLFGCMPNELGETVRSFWGAPLVVAERRAEREEYRRAHDERLEARKAAWVVAARGRPLDPLNGLQVLRVAYGCLRTLSPGHGTYPPMEALTRSGFPCTDIQTHEENEEPSLAGRRYAEGDDGWRWRYTPPGSRRSRPQVHARGAAGLAHRSGGSRIQSQKRWDHRLAIGPRQRVGLRAERADAAPSCASLRDHGGHPD